MKNTIEAPLAHNARLHHINIDNPETAKIIKQAARWPFSGGVAGITKKIGQHNEDENDLSQNDTRLQEVIIGDRGRGTIDQRTMVLYWWKRWVERIHQKRMESNRRLPKKLRKPHEPPQSLQDPIFPQTSPAQQ